MSSSGPEHRPRPTRAGRQPALPAASWASAKSWCVSVRGGAPHREGTHSPFRRRAETPRQPAEGHTSAHLPSEKVSVCTTHALYPRRQHLIPEARGTLKARHCLTQALPCHRPLPRDPTSPRLQLRKVRAPEEQSHQLNTIALCAGQEGGSQGLATQEPSPAWKGLPRPPAPGVFRALPQSAGLRATPRLLARVRTLQASREAAAADGRRGSAVPPAFQPQAASALSRLTSGAPARPSRLSAPPPPVCASSTFCPLPARPTPAAPVSFKLQFKCHFAHGARLSPVPPRGPPTTPTLRAEFSEQQTLVPPGAVSQSQEGRASPLPPQHRGLGEQKLSKHLLN